MTTRRRWTPALAWLLAVVLSACTVIGAEPDTSTLTATSPSPATTTRASSPPAGTSPPVVTVTTSTTPPTSPSTTTPSTSATPTKPPLDPATEAWFTADCTAQAELRRLSMVSSGTTLQQQRETVEQVYRQFSEFGRRTRAEMATLDPPAVPGGAEIKQSRLAEFEVVDLQYGAGLERLREADPQTSAELSEVIEEVETSVNAAIAAIPKPSAGLPPEVAEQVMALPACSASPVPTSPSGTPSGTAPSTSTGPTV